MSKEFQETKTVNLEQEVTLIAHRYAELFEIACGALDCYRIFIKTDDKDTALYRKYNKLEGKQHLIICITFSIAAIEAFVNHVGYIVDDEWQKHEAKKFFVQYKKLISTLKRVEVESDDLLNVCYPDFESHREFMRNPIQHPHASKHDSAYSKKLIEDSQSTEHFNTTGSEFLNLWANITIDDAEKSVNGAKQFIKNICNELENNFHVELRNEKRKSLLMHLIEFPFSTIPIVTGVTTLINE